MNKKIRGYKLQPLAIAAGLIASGIAVESAAHGYVSEPAGRPLLCKLGDNTGCGAVQWEPQSVEGPDGAPRYPVGGPTDGTIAAAGSPSWSELNAQSPSRWFKHEFAAGYQTFEWTFTANHVSKDWRYFITKADWNPAAPLSRDAFELSPFCEYDGGMERPPMVIQHNCYVPEREGYHVIMAVWDVGDTAASFYNAIDVNFAGDNVITTPEPEVDAFAEVGLISGAIALQAGDTISTRVYDKDGEIPSLSVSYEADGYTSGGAAALALAHAINDAAVGYSAGQRDGDMFIPVAGQNKIYSDTGITNVETRVDYAPEPEFVYAATLVADDRVEINDMGMTDVNFTVSVNANSMVTATLYNDLGDTIIGDEWSVGGEANLKLHVHEAVAGELTLVVIANSIDTNGTEQLTTAVMVEDNHEPMEPNTDGQDHSGMGHDHMGSATCDMTDPMAGMHPTYSDATTYTGGEKVSYQGLVYQAKWWTRGNAPDRTDAFELISDVVLEYNDSTVYQGGDRARYQGKLYEAKWWTRGTAPSDRDPWTLVGDVNC
jgi:predicted carbohydrate-binding protein with CBM5 and CBM33 domain